MGARAVIVGFYGKLPARGDFVRTLPRDFTDAWDGWLAPALAGSREAMGADWLPAFLEAPVWRFSLPAGLCGARAVLGLMLPSVDNVGRYFPLVFAALFDHGAAPADDPGWLDACETAGRAALEQDTGPEQLGVMIGVPAAPGVAGPAERDMAHSLWAHSVWWTEGAPRVEAMRLVLPGLPDAGVYATMLGAAAPQGTAPESSTNKMPNGLSPGISGAPTGRQSWGQCCEHGSTPLLGDDASGDETQA
jgi:type VI secretion system protein ImpM